MSQSRFISCLIAVTFVLVSASSVYADIVPVGALDFMVTRTSGAGGGIFGTEQWANGGFVFSWEITPNIPTSDFTYQYWITGPNGGDLPKEVSHWILQLTEVDVWSGVFDTVGGPTEVKTNTEQQGNPSLPSDIFGVKFDFGGDTVHLEFTTPQAPVWGDFYAIDGGGKNGGGPVYAYNDNFGTMPVDGVTNDFTGWIARPDGDLPLTPSPVPEPATLVLVGTGLLAGGLRFRKRLK